jgi:HEAT repeat protein
MSKAILKPFEDYQKARFTFVQSIADLAQRPQNILALHSAGVIQLLKPLLLDSVQVIQQSAALAIGRLANFSVEIAESVVQNDIITQLIYSLSNQNRFYKKAACYVLRAVAKHSDKLADDIVKSGALDPLVRNLNDLDPSVKESAAWALGYISKHSPQLAEQVVEARAIDNLILCLRDPEVELKRAATQTLSYIAYHTPELAVKIVENGLELISSLLMDNDIQLKRNICLLLGNIAKHSFDLSLAVWNSLQEPKLLLGCLMSPDLVVKKNTAFCICEIVNKGLENAMKIAKIGGIGILVHFIANVKGEPRLYGIIALGFIAAHNEKLAEGIIDVYGINYLKEALESESSPQIKAACCYALGQIGKHAPKHANKIAEHNILALIMNNINESHEHEDLYVKGRRALKKIIKNCNSLKHLEPLLKSAPPKVMKYILDQYELFLKDSREYKREFVESGGLRKLQELKSDENYPDELKKKIDKINENYHMEVINFHSPNFKETIAKKLNDYAYSQD